MDGRLTEQRFALRALGGCCLFPCQLVFRTGRHVRRIEPRAPVRSLIELPVWCISSFSSGDEGEVADRDGEV